MINTFYPTTNKYDVHLNVSGGWNSTSNIWNTVRRLYERSNKGKKKIVILYFGDLDPSGSDMTRDVEDRLNEFGLNVEIKRILINIDDIERYRLVKRFDVRVKKGEKVYNKIEADPRAKRFYDKFGELFQVEVEAIDPKVLIERLEESILEYVDSDEHNRIKKKEQKEVEEIKKRLGWKK